VKKTIAWMIILSLVTSTSAWAQIRSEAKPATALPPLPNAKVICGSGAQWDTEVPMSMDQWMTLTMAEQADVCKDVLEHTTCAKPAKVPQADWDVMNAEARGRVCQVAARQARGAGEIKTGQWSHPKLVGGGALMILIGMLMIIPQGTDYHILGDTFCVDTYSVDYGSCNHPASVVQAGLIVVGVGALLAFAGSREKVIKVSPTLSPKMVGATATIRWGK
jgi:hypothetical protein